MSTSSVGPTVGDLVTERPSRSRVFSKLGIDFCCGGGRTLEEVCSARGLDVADVQAMLDREPPAPDHVDWRTEPLGALVDYIETTHHVFTRTELPRLDEMLAKVARVHGARHPYMVEVAASFSRFASELLAHLDKEERVLFPAIRERGAGRAMPLDRPIAVMMREHDDAGATLSWMREQTGGFVPPEGACNTFRAALAGLEELERDLHEHVHLENNVLFPRVHVTSRA